MGIKLPFNSEILELAEHQDCGQAQKLIDAVEKENDALVLVRLATDFLNYCVKRNILTQEEVLELLEPNDDEIDIGDNTDAIIKELVEGEDDDGSADFDMVASTVGIPETEVENEEDEEDN